MKMITYPLLLTLALALTGCGDEYNSEACLLAAQSKLEVSDQNLDLVTVTDNVVNGDRVFTLKWSIYDVCRQMPVIVDAYAMLGYKHRAYFNIYADNKWKLLNQRILRLQDVPWVYEYGVFTIDPSSKTAESEVMDFSIRINFKTTGDDWRDYDIYKEFLHSWEVKVDYWQYDE